VTLHGLIPLLAKEPSFQHLLKHLSNDDQRYEMPVLESAAPFLIAALQQKLRLPLLIITSSPDKARRLCEELGNWCDNLPGILHFPEIDSLVYEQVISDTAITHQRLQVISVIREFSQSELSNANIPVVIASASAVTRKTITPKTYDSSSHVLSPGTHAKPMDLLAKWVEIGYEIESTVVSQGTASRRGGIIDIYSPNNDFPVRIEFFGDEIETIRTFDPQSQRSLENLSSVVIVPATETSESANGTIFDYLPEQTLVILENPLDIETTTREIESLGTEAWHKEAESQETGNLSHLSWQELETRLAHTRYCLALTRWSSNENTQFLLPPPTFEGQLTTFLQKVQKLLHEKYRVIIVSQQAARLSELLHEENICTIVIPEISDIPAKKSVVLVRGSLSGGWRTKDTILLTDAEIFGFVKQQRFSKKRAIVSKAFLQELTEGDHVVHIDHGVGHFVGMTKKTIDGIEREYLILEYAANDKLYVPVDQADRISRYSGSGAGGPTLSRLGTQEWAKVKERVSASAKDKAQELLDLYASREIVHGITFSNDTPWQQELESSFPYMETPDQLEVLQKIKEDMEQPKPMDRMICGDVGYGKTEIALRAAFKAVMDSKQVALLVPTTVLAQQHFTTFSERLSPFPTTIEMLSRFRSDKEQQSALKGLASGVVDICIGTHRLLQKDVHFKDLGLVIIDEEQRFGVSHKERLKQMRKEVDVLSLSATPIPRTLHMSLAGVRDMSIMETPPEERVPIRTFVSEFDDQLVRRAIIRELEREGQIFFVHNRVHSISKIVRQLTDLVPEAKISVGHGQMPEDQLEKVMLDFINRKMDVLVCTTIIESGLDIARANTLIINDADKFGLSQLHQLRGRVGRGSNMAYAYFLYAKGKQLTETAERRLQTIYEATALGAGFQIAMRDLEIRGAGNLLGTQQSGHITAVGFDLYCQLLAQAVEELKNGEGKDSSTPVPTPTIDLPISYYVPEDYIEPENTRILLYQRLAKVKSFEEIKQIAEELRDRFGELPPPVKSLLYMSRIKMLAPQARVKAISTTSQGQIMIDFVDDNISTTSQFNHTAGLKKTTSGWRLDIRHARNGWAETLVKLLKSEANSRKSNVT